MSRNPYIVAGQEPTLRQPLFVFMDILGYGDLMLQAQEAGTQQNALRDLHSALSASRRGLEDMDLPAEFRATGSKDFFALKAFTDNIVIGWPVHSDAEVEFGGAFMRLAQFPGGHPNSPTCGHFKIPYLSVVPLLLACLPLLMGSASPRNQGGHSRSKKVILLLMTDRKDRNRFVILNLEQRHIS
jgi:hypothetical protein